MVLASTVSGGPESEVLVLAVAMLILGVVFLVSKNVTRIVPILLILGSLVVGAGAFAFR
ncbi:MAG: hypothetical protein ACR2LG_08050 [Actinomycetota bacterium]|nr:hypothetical protein [Actinomycetota bacterium]